ncbi:hypothetical protein PAECIP111891_02193 [Paenibacillus allorhizoplanae]|uniref:Baseplate J/gp47 family protein n=1 Tax=Paenibacillus allorhizoplanae TaxID=2905648 RepID=A0ABN8GC78_9BACL|nr:baseplate J/gp47 family protein [Paenibacillus allorhizoplanae]CAH1202994.1 hypothetical protein PAECIP111891_02193 [Paenibacillus allorhizoplanae]
MYESQSYSVILQRMLDRVPDDVDKRQGSIIYDALAPAASEIAEMYVALDSSLRAVFPNTATDVYLDAITAPFGQARRTGTYAVRKGVFTGAGGSPFDVPIGSRFSISGNNFVVQLRIAAGEFELKCETLGQVGNQNFGTMLPLDYIAGLVSASLNDVLIPGEDQESDAQYRARFLQQVRLPSTSGNKADYMKWALEVEGIGGVQIIPLWNGAGTVKVVIIDTDKKPASTQLVQNVQAYISPTPGTGDGAAPVGATVSVVAATLVSINVAATIVRDGSRTLAQIKADFEADLTSHLAGIAFGTDPSVKYAKIGAILLSVSGVQDYTALQLNGTNGNISIGQGAVAVKGTVTLSG